MEACRYIALNTTAEECSKNVLQCVLPWRRSSKGVRPGLRGAGPRGKARGDLEQWCFPQVTLGEGEKLEIVSQVISLAAKAMFKHQYYNFGGKWKEIPPS